MGGDKLRNGQNLHEFDQQRLRKESGEAREVFFPGAATLRQARVTCRDVHSRHRRRKWTSRAIARWPTFACADPTPGIERVYNTRRYSAIEKNWPSLQPPCPRRCVRPNACSDFRSVFANKFLTDFPVF
ncbi:hypothetical protein CRG98_005467 [Punica granatum]|uniref:Uncharacterized protein n=1 Tax=Punica granatum TaxID=22663 RepID=A0A2I0L0A0_PUNGR|nr:hypothetical protein CRG98_005467 [Punica granatum]